ncbi:MAG: pyridoxamine 5'-phosphate oxidase [Candidatus Puniceispirillaceae bacterium]
MTVLGADELNTDPFLLFNQWFAEAQQSEINDPDAIALASVDADGMPSVRMVLLKEILPEGFVFYTNYTSRKSGELMATGKAAFVIHWKSLRRQIRVTGSVEQVPDAQSDAYYQTRSRGSRIGAWASQQSKPLQNRGELAAAVRKIEETYPDEVPRPTHWGGFLIRPAEIEFWADGDFRLHDRFRYTKDVDGNWASQRLYP